VYTGVLRVIVSPVPVALCAALAIGAWAAVAQTKTQTQKATSKTTSKTTAKSTVAKSTAATSAKKKPSAKTTPASVKAPAKTAPTTTAKRAPTKRPVAVVHHSQQQPTTDRYKEIQQALSAKGYFTGEADGNWGPASVDALKRFQRDQNIPDDGKLGSLSLIALGLGPKRESADQPQKAAESEQKIP